MCAEPGTLIVWDVLRALGSLVRDGAMTCSDRGEVVGEVVGKRGQETFGQTLGHGISGTLSLCPGLPGSNFEHDY